MRRGKGHKRGRNWETDRRLKFANSKDCFRPQEIGSIAV